MSKNEYIKMDEWCRENKIDEFINTVQEEWMEFVEKQMDKVCHHDFEEDR